MTSTDSESLWHNRNFRRFFFGQFVTNAGDSLYTVAVMWLVFELSGSTVLTGIANAILLLPWLLQIFVGPVVDRLPLKPLLVGSQLLQGAVVLVIPLAAFTGRLSVGVVFSVLPVLMLASLIAAPMRAAIVPRIVRKSELSRANSSLATITLGLDMVFDALGGILIAVVGVTTLFLIDSVTFAVAALLFAGMVIPPPTDEEPTTTDDSVVRSYVDDLQAGINVLRGTVFVELVALAAVANIATGITLAILPAFADSLGGPAIYGFLLGALGIGRLVGSLIAPSLETVAYGRLVLVGYAIGACCWLAAVYAPSTTLTVVLFGAAWIAGGVDGVLTSTLNQSIFPDVLLGRVSATKGTAAGATLPLGSLIGGVVAELLGTTTTMALSAFGFGTIALYALVRPRVRNLPAVADATPADFGVSVEVDPAHENGM